MSNHAVPTIMKALQLEKPPGEQKKGARNIAAVREVPVPKPGKGQVLVKIEAAGFNHRDEWSMKNAYPALIFKNSTMGCDGAGIVIAPKSHPTTASSSNAHPDKLVLLVPTRGWREDPAGPEAELPGASPEQRKNGLGGQGFGILGSTAPTAGVGCFSEYVVVEDDQIVPAPKHLNAVQAATIPCGGVTAYRALFTKAQLQRGQNLLITGIGGGVALIALQFAVAAGANVWVTSSSEEKLAKAKELGAKGGVSYKDANWPKALASQLPSSRPYLDAVVDSAGGDITAKVAKVLRPGGKVVCFGMTAAPSITVTMREVLKNAEVLGSTMGSEREFRACVRFIEEHKIVPLVDTVLDGLDQAHRGFELLQDAGKRTGKVVIRFPSQEQCSKL